MSHRAIAAVLARDDLASGERLVALSLASFADRTNRAWPGAPAAAVRAGLGRSRYLQAREQLVARGLVVVDEHATGRGRSTTVSLAFADAGPWWDGEINVQLFEAVLGYCAARGPARLLLATLAAVADGDGLVRDLSTEQLCAAAGIADRTYRRARQELLATGELSLVSGVGGRGNTNVWHVRDPRSDAAEPRRVPRRVAPPAGARPLVASAKGGQDWTVHEGNSPIVTGVSALKPGQDRTLFELPALETPAQRAAETPAETPAPYARAGREPQNPRTREDPPSPPAGGSSPNSMVIEQTYITDRGRRRRRTVRVDLDAVRRGLGIPAAGDRRDWQRICELLEERVGESTFAIWLKPIELIAIDRDRFFVLAAPATTTAWTSKRFGSVLEACALRIGREVRFAEEPERHAFGVDPPSFPTLSINQKEAAR